MYGLPENFDGAFLVGRKLEMICFNANQINLHFDDHITVTIEGAFSHRRAQSESAESAVNVPVLESALMQLLERSVSEVSGGRDGTLTVTFDNGHVLKCFDSFPNYESYQIKHGEEVIIV